jgi:hypothetical protein
MRDFSIPFRRDFSIPFRRDFSIPFSPSLPTFAAPASLDNPAATAQPAGLGLVLSRPSVAPLSRSAAGKSNRAATTVYT